MHTLRYVPEIDGLRAVAVLSVVFYHLGFSWIPGGFLGVDIFFVISGYLITAILLRETEANGESRQYFSNFYLRRLCRIFPALFVVILTTLFAAYYILRPEDYLELARSALAAVSFVSNIYFYFNTGYFDAPAETMPLLHTWSLAVEEQFYLIWPAVIFALSGLAIHSRIAIFTIIFLASLALSVYVTPINPMLAFYNFPFRIFQFMLGAIIPLVLMNSSSKLQISSNNSALLQIVGLALIASSVFQITMDDPIPGLLALAPCLGASFIILSALNPHKLIAKLLNNNAFVGIGKISFSLYLWHWPIITLYKIYAATDDLSLSERIAILALSVLLSIASYKYVEQPFRIPTKQWRTVTFSIATGFAVLMFSGLVLQTNGFVDRVPNDGRSISTKDSWEWDCPKRVTGVWHKSLCNFGLPWDTADVKVVLWGDSHAAHLAPLLEVVAEKYQISAVIVPACRQVTDGATVLIRSKNPARATEGCYEAIQHMQQLLTRDKRIKLVVIAGAWRIALGQVHSANEAHPELRQRALLMQKGLAATTSMITKLDVDVLILGDVPSLVDGSRRECAGATNLLRKSTPNCSLSRKFVEIHQRDAEDVLLRVAEANPRVGYHNIIASHCRSGDCSLFSMGEFIYRDTDHIRRNFSSTQKKELANSFGLIEATTWKNFSVSP